jgi:type 1 glutamine amidotransferase
MKISYKQLLGSALMALMFLSLVSVKPEPRFRVLAVMSKAKDHIKMMAAAMPMLQKMADDNNFKIDITDDTSTINDANLKNYQVFLMLQEAPFDMSYAQQDALQKFVDSGKGWVGVHAAGLTGKQFLGPDKKYWQWFEGLMGNVIYSPHPPFQQGTVIIEDRNSPITKGLPAKMEISDEWYEFDKSPRGNVHVLATADESTYKQRKPMGDHPIIWINEKFRRMVYIGIGHDASLCVNPDYIKLLHNSIEWAASK